MHISPLSTSPRHVFHFSPNLPAQRLLLPRKTQERQTCSGREMDSDGSERTILKGKKRGSAVFCDTQGGDVGHGGTNQSRCVPGRLLCWTK